MNYILFDDQSWENLLPLTFTRPVSEIRIGILTIKEKWEKFLHAPCSYLTKEYLKVKYPIVTAKENILINSSFLPNKKLINNISELNINEALIFEDNLLAVKLNNEKINEFILSNLKSFKLKKVKSDSIQITNTWDIFKKNREVLISDFEVLTKNRASAPLSSTNKVIYKKNIFIEKGAKVEHAILNASDGPIYIGGSAEIMEGSLVRGGLALCNNSTLKLGAKIYGPTTIGPYSKVGGEVKNSIILGYSSKSHDGYLGNSVLGEWCNIGADSNNSNLKNNYANVKLWNYKIKEFLNTGLQYCGLIMGDHSKCGINTMFNTGTVVGVFANIFGSGFPRNFIPSFSWGGAQGFTTYSINKAFEVAEKVMERRNILLSQADKEILHQVFEDTKEYRNFKL